MKYSLVVLAAAAGVVQASPFAFPVPQAVTAKISPTASPPSGCSISYSGTFGFAVMNVTSASGAQPVSTRTDGQPNASTGTVAPVKTISDGQPQATTGSASAIKTISDGQPQVSTGTASAIKTISDGQPQVSTGKSSSVMMMTGAPVMQISDGQIQGMMHTMTMMPVSQTGSTMTITMMPVTTIKDGQPQAPTMPQPSTSTVTGISTIKDGQPQAPAATATASASAIKTISDGQPQVSTGSASAIKTISDGQPQVSTGTASAVKTISDGQPQVSTSATASGATSSASASSMPMVMVACKSNSTLQVTLAGSVLTDNIGRIGYIAANYQFQFDGPPQAGAIYTAGFSVCSNGSLALGGSAVFYQCLSGNFYNLYDRNWAPQCSPVTINVVQLISC